MQKSQSLLANIGLSISYLNALSGSTEFKMDAVIEYWSIGQFSLLDYLVEFIS